MEREIPDIFRVLQSLFPILIFIFWVVITLFANARKQNKRRLEKPAGGGAGGSGRSAPYQSRTSKEQEQPTGRFGQMRQSIESIFAEMSQGTDQEPREADHGIADAEAHQYDTAAITASAAKAAQKSADQETARKADLAIYEGGDSISSSEIKGEEFAKTSGRSALHLSLESRDELKRAVLWSEVIGSPVALRDDSRGYVAD